MEEYESSTPQKLCMDSVMNELAAEAMWVSDFIKAKFLDNYGCIDGYNGHNGLVSIAAPAALPLVALRSLHEILRQIVAQPSYPALQPTEQAVRRVFNPIGDNYFVPVDTLTEDMAHCIFVAVGLILGLSGTYEKLPGPRVYTLHYPDRLNRFLSILTSSMLTHECPSALTDAMDIIDCITSPFEILPNPGSRVARNANKKKGKKKKRKN